MTTTKPRKLQEIFDTALPFYEKDPTLGMCCAVGSIWQEGRITEAEMNKADKAIRTYLSYDLISADGTPRKLHHSYLVKALRMSNRPHAIEDMIAIYKNWAKRPRLKKRITVSEYWDAHEGESYRV